MKGTVLIADDDDLLREAFSSILQWSGWTTLQARHGKEAIDILGETPVDVVILDQRMPEMCGREVCQQLRRTLPALPIILVTAAADIEALALELGLRCFLSKPVSMDTLIDTVERALAGNC